MRYGCFLLEYREDEERQADFCRKEASSPLLEMTASFTNGTIFNGNLMVSNNIIIVVFRPFSFHITAVYTEVCVQSQFSGVCD